jgi:hypothetical protein
VELKPETILNVSIEGKRIILESALEPPEIFVELGEMLEEILRESRRESEERIKRLLRDLGVEGNS